MIVSASYRTDIPAFYADWFCQRLAAGFADVRNPWGGPSYRVSLLPADVDGFVFWTRNPTPFREALDAVTALGMPFDLQVTLTGYPRALERSTPPPDSVLREMRELAGRYGPRAVVWRYDPVLLTTITPAAYHRKQVASLAAALSGSVDEVVFSYATDYRKTARNLAAAARQHGFQRIDASDDEKRAVLADLGTVASEAGLTPTLCAQPDLLSPPLRPARCIDAERLSDVAGRALPVRQKGNRPGCFCAESRDIGAYDTCPHGCAYCYAVSDRDKAVERHAAQESSAARLGQ